jgi:hypothetical protein
LESEEIAALYAAYGGELWRGLLVVSGGRADIAKEATAEAFARLVANADSVRELDLSTSAQTSRCLWADADRHHLDEMPAAYTVGMRTRHAIWLIPLLFAAAGLLVMVVATGGAAWTFALGWCCVIGVVGLVERLAPTKRIRVFVALIVVLGLPVLVFEGGLFVWPAALALLFAAAIAPPPSASQRLA